MTTPPYEDEVITVMTGVDMGGHDDDDGPRGGQSWRGGHIGDESGDHNGAYMMGGPDGWAMG